MAAHPVLKLCLEVLLGIALAPYAEAASVDGSLGFPSADVPPLQIYAREVDTARLQSLHARAGQVSFHFELPAGRYVFFAVPGEAGAPQIYGAHTAYSDCHARDPQAECTGHDLAVVTLAPTTRLAGLILDDWYLPDSVAGDLDRILGITVSPTADELGAPHFSEYPIVESVPPAAPKIEAVTATLDVDQRAALVQALASGPNFAGHLSVLSSACGVGCTQLLLFDWHGAQIVPAEALPRLTAPLPCRRGEALRFRRDSRLLSTTQVRGTTVVTRYFVWKSEPAGLTQTAEYQRTAELFCATATP
jgi:hypothetical protein